MEPLSSADAEDRFERLVAECLDPLYKTAYRLTGSPHAAQDLAHDTFVKARRAIPSLPHDANARAWLFRILRNGWIDHVRKSAREPQLLPVDEIPECAEPPAPEKIEVMDRESRRRLEQCLDDRVLAAMEALPEDMRLAVLFQTFGGLNYEEISLALECPIGTVMSRLHRAKARLREELAAYAASRGITQIIQPGGDHHAQA